MQRQFIFAIEKTGALCTTKLNALKHQHKGTTFIHQTTIPLPLVLYSVHCKLLCTNSKGPFLEYRVGRTKSVLTALHTKQHHADMSQSDLPRQWSLVL
jgi:hypothetical protein